MFDVKKGVSFQSSAPRHPLENPFLECDGGILPPSEHCEHQVCSIKQGMKSRTFATGKFLRHLQFSPLNLEEGSVQRGRVRGLAP